MTIETLKTYAIIALTSAAAYFAPLFVPLALIAAFDIIDFVVGVRAARKRGEKFTMSHAYSRTMDKITGQGAFMGLAFICQIHFFPNAPLIWITECAVMWVEVVSIREKAKELYGVDVFKDAIKIMKRNSRKEDKE